MPRWRFVSTGWYTVTPDIQVSVNYQTQDGLAVNPVAAGQDLLGTGVTGTRTPGLDPFSFRAPFRNSFDSRFTWLIPVAAKQRLRLSAEVYNLFNHENVIAVNNNYGANSGTPNAVWLTPTGYSPPREVQLSIKYQF